MLFNSFTFLLFFPVVTVLFFLLPHRFRWFHLLVASCVFYMAFVPAYLLILAFTIAVDYCAGILIERAQGRRRKLYLGLSLLANLGVLAVFKYYDFFVSSMNAVLHAWGSSASGPLLRLVLPIGLSFHTFQAMSYTIEVYRGRCPAERHFGIYALYVLFFPQLVAGPIERPQNVLPQLRERKLLSYEAVTSGLRLMAWGLFKKVVIADRLATLVNEVYGAPQQFQGLPLVVATVFFSIQIYCDFSGYSDMAVGIARILGFRLMKNFDRPYLATSISDYWRRWHISLSTWFRDYVYFPLGGRRVSVPRGYLNLLVVFLLSGLWHGASWTFVVWGGLNGMYLVLERLTQATRQRLAAHRLLAVLRAPLLGLLTTFALVTFARIFFRANTLTDAVYIIGHLFGGGETDRPGALPGGVARVYAFYTAGEWLALTGALGILVLVEKMQDRLSLNTWIIRQAAPLRWTLYYGLVGYIALLGAFETVRFIYFQF